MQKIKVLYLNVQENKPPEVLEIEDDNHVFYKLIGYDGMDITRRFISGKWYQIICDDCGRLRPRAKLALCDSAVENPIAGNIIITGTADRFGELTSLTDADVEAICDRKLKWMSQWIITQADTFENENQNTGMTCVPPPQPGERVFCVLSDQWLEVSDDED